MPNPLLLHFNAHKNATKITFVRIKVIFVAVDWQHAK